MVGVINTIFGYSCYAILIFIGLHYSLAVMISTILGVMFNFKTLGVYVFKNNSNLLLFKFIMVYFIIYWVNIGLIKIFYNKGFDLYFSGILALLICPILSYFLNKFVVFKRSGVIEKID